MILCFFFLACSIDCCWLLDLLERSRHGDLRPLPVSSAQPLISMCVCVYVNSLVYQLMVAQLLPQDAKVLDANSDFLWMWHGTEILIAEAVVSFLFVFSCCCPRSSLSIKHCAAPVPFTLQQARFIATRIARPKRRFGRDFLFKPTLHRLHSIVSMDWIHSTTFPTFATDIVFCLCVLLAPFDGCVRTDHEGWVFGVDRDEG